MEGKLTVEDDGAAIGTGVAMADTMPSEGIAAPKYTIASRMVMRVNIMDLNS
jgi:hypothetical protein